MHAPCQSSRGKRPRPFPHLLSQRRDVAHNGHFRPRQLQLNFDIEPALIIGMSADEEHLFVHTRSPAEFIESNGTKCFGREPEQDRGGETEMSELPLDLRWSRGGI